MGSAGLECLPFGRAIGEASIASNSDSATDSHRLHERQKPILRRVHRDEPRQHQLLHREGAVDQPSRHGGHDIQSFIKENERKVKTKTDE